MKHSVVDYIEALEARLGSPPEGTSGFGPILRIFDFHARIHRLVFATEDCRKTGLSGLTIQEIPGTRACELAIRCFIHREELPNATHRLFFLRPEIFEAKIEELAESLLLETTEAGRPQDASGADGHDVLDRGGLSPAGPQRKADAGASYVPGRPWDPNRPESFFAAVQEESS